MLVFAASFKANLNLDNSLKNSQMINQLSKLWKTRVSFFFTNICCTPTVWGHSSVSQARPLLWDSWHSSGSWSPAGAGKQTPVDSHPPNLQTPALHISSPMLPHPALTAHPANSYLTFGNLTSPVALAVSDPSCTSLFLNTD